MEPTRGKIIAVCTSAKKGVPKKNVGAGVLDPASGLVGDAHAEPGVRQLSLLATESIDKMNAKGAKIDITPGDFAENLTTAGIILHKLPVGLKLKIGEEVTVEVSQIGKVCPKPCAVYHRVGDCIMPREGVFARILEGGKVKVGDVIEAA